MITRGVPDLHPDSSKWYWLEFAQTELGAGVTIQTVIWTAPPELTVDETDHVGTLVGVRLRSATAVIDELYDVTAQIVTTAPELIHETLRIRVSEEGH